MRQLSTGINFLLNKTAIKVESIIIISISISISSGSNNNIIITLNDSIIYLPQFCNFPYIFRRLETYFRGVTMLSTVVTTAPSLLSSSSILSFS
jgi:hypothetical protein